jgi:hypothetical protein
LRSICDRTRDDRWVRGGTTRRENSIRSRPAPQAQMSLAVVAFAPRHVAGEVRAPRPAPGRRQLRRAARRRGPGHAHQRDRPRDTGGCQRCGPGGNPPRGIETTIVCRSAAIAEQSGRIPLLSGRRARPPAPGRRRGAGPMRPT